MRRMGLVAAFTIAASLTGCGGGAGDSLLRALSPQSAEMTALSAPVTNAGAVRFLEQSTFGPTPEAVAHLQAIGYDAWLTEQFALKPTPIARVTDKTSFDALQAAFFNNAVNAPDH